ncbi:MAG: ATP-binding protein [Pseudomonadota bacterium]
MSLRERLKYFWLSGMKLKTKLLLGMSVILIVIMGSFTYIDVFKHQKDFIRQTENMAAEISETILQGIKYPMLDGEMEQVQNVLSHLAVAAPTNLDVAYLCNVNGVIQYSGNESDIGRNTMSQITLKALAEERFAQGLENKHINGTTREKVFRYAIPILNEPACHKCHSNEDRLLGVLTVGYDWAPIERLIAGHRNRDILISIISLLAISFFLTKWISTLVTRPISILTNWAKELSNGQLDARFTIWKRIPCWDWEIKECVKKDCPAYGEKDIRCWHVDNKLCNNQDQEDSTDKPYKCQQCRVYKSCLGDEIVQLADAFRLMAWQQKKYREELKRVYESSLHSERLASIGKGVAHISHEIKNPLIVIGGFVRQVFRSASVDGKAQEKLKIVIDEIARLESLLLNISDFTKFSSPEKDLANVNELIREVIALMDHEIRKHGIEIQEYLDPGIPDSYYDSRQIKQVLINVIKNAIEAMPHGGRLDISTRVEKEFVTIETADTGKGIDPEMLTKLFHSFVTSKPQGSGPGLAISQKIIQEHGGTIQFASELGKGTSCVIKLPREQ